MEPRMEEKNRFRIDELEARIAPANALCTGLVAATAHTAGTQASLDDVFLAFPENHPLADVLCPTV